MGDTAIGITPHRSLFPHQCISFDLLLRCSIVQVDAMDASLREALTSSRPAFLFGTVPAMEGTPLPKVREQAVKFAAKMRELAADGYIVYDIQEEAGRTEEPRPFPFRRMSDPVEYAGTIGIT